MTVRSGVRLVVAVAAFFAAIAGIGAVHSILHGYTEIYTSIFILIGFGYLLIVYVLLQVVKGIY